jgi:hypothetical protein
VFGWSGIWAIVDDGMKTNGLGAMGADAALLNELVRTSLDQDSAGDRAP